MPAGTVPTVVMSEAIKQKLSRPIWQVKIKFKTLYLNGGVIEL